MPALFGPHPALFIKKCDFACTLRILRTFSYSLGFPHISRSSFEGNKGFFVTTYQNTPKPQQIRPFSPPSRILFDLVCFKIST